MVVGEAHKYLVESEAYILIEHLTGLSRSQQIINPQRELSQDQERKFFELVARRKTGYPLQYILGYWWFYDLELEVEEGVLIPRPETEILVEEALKYARDGDRILDIGIGTGAISLSLAKARKGAEIIGVDINPQAVDLAERNRLKHSIENVEFFISNLFENVEGTFDMIVTNPPYVSEDEDLELELSYEPDEALYSGKTGLDLIEKIIPQSKEYLTKYGIIIIEIGYDQGERVVSLLEENGFKAQILKDYSGFDRVAVGKVL